MTTPKVPPPIPTMYPPPSIGERNALDSRLEAFLRSCDEDTQRGHTIANLRLDIRQYHIRQNQIEARFNVFASDQENLIERVDGHDRRLDAHGNALLQMKRRLRTGDEDIEMSTGNFDLKTIQKEVEEQRLKRMHSERVKADNVQWWQRQVVLWIIGGSGATALVILSVLITLILGRK